MKTFNLLFCLIMLCACGNGQKQNTVEKESSKEQERIENISINVPEDCIQVYENS